MQGRASQVSPRLFREGPASTQVCTRPSGVVQPIHRQAPLPAGRPPQADGGSWPQGWLQKIRPKPTLGTRGPSRSLASGARALCGRGSGRPLVRGVWTGRVAPCWISKSGAGPEVGRLWPGRSRGCGGGGEGLRAHGSVLQMPRGVGTAGPWPLSTGRRPPCWQQSQPESHWPRWMGPRSQSWLRSLR